jgi:16S rRNA G966 N2-methylase RsmD
LSLEQSSSEITARYKAALCSGQCFADLTGGFGIDMAFIAAKFEKAFYVERQTELCDIATHNFGILGLSHITVFNRDAVDFVQDMPGVDMIFLDPARRGHGGQKVFRFTIVSRMYRHLKKTLLTKALKVMIQSSPMLDISQLQKCLHTSAKYIYFRWIMSVKVAGHYGTRL